MTFLNPNDTAMEGLIELEFEMETENDCFYLNSLPNIESTWLRMILATLFHLIPIISIFGNCFVIVIQAWGQKTRKRSKIRGYLIHLAIADMLIGILAPFQYSNIVLGYWNYINSWCPVVQFLKLLAVFVSSLILSLIALERYLVVKNTTYRYFHLMESHRQQVLTSVWILGTFYGYALNSTRAVSFAVGEHIYVECAPLNDHSDLERLALASANLIFTCIIPSILIIYTYRFIQIKVKRSMRNGNVAYAVNFNPSTNDTKNVAKVIQPPKYKITVRRHYKEVSLDDRQRISKMFLIVILAFTICWLPIKTLQFFHLTFKFSLCLEWQYFSMLGIYIAFYWLAMANSMLNLFIYSLTSLDFQHDAKIIWQKLRNSFSNCFKKVKKDKNNDHLPGTNQMLNIFPKEHFI